MTKTLIDIDDEALNRAQRVRQTTTKKDTVNERWLRSLPSARADEISSASRPTLMPIFEWSRHVL